MEFLRPTLLYYALLALPIAWGLVSLHRARLRMLTRLYDALYIAKLRVRFIMILQTIAAVLMVVSIAFAVSKPVLRSPQQLPQQREVETKNRAMYIMLDVSSSMYVRDVDNATRMKKAFEFMYSYINKGLHDLYGLIVYTDTPVLISPLTHDVSFLLNVLRSFSNTPRGYGTSDFTSTFETLEKNYDMFFSGMEVANNRAIMFISDGESHTKPSKYLFQTFVEKNYGITIASVGSIEGAPVPNAQNFVSQANHSLMQGLSWHPRSTYININSDNLEQLLAAVHQSAQTRLRHVSFIGYIIAFLCMCVYISIEKL